MYNAQTTKLLFIWISITQKEPPQKKQGRVWSNTKIVITWTFLMCLYFFVGGDYKYGGFQKWEIPEMNGL